MANTKNIYVNKFTQEPLTTYAPTAFMAIREQYGLDPVVNRTSDSEKLEEQRKRFMKKQVCPICGSPKTYIRDTNIMVCTNDKCTGFVRKDEEGKIISATPAYSELTVKGEAVATSILD